MKIEIEITEEDAALIEQFMDEVNQCGEFTTHGLLDMIVLAGMLMEDVALTVSRPGSWEGANMRQVLTLHGYNS